MIIFRSLSIQTSCWRGCAPYCGGPVDLTAMEFDLLALLIRAAGRVVSRDEITAALFEREATPYDRFLDVHISHLRKKLKHGRGLIRTIRGVGYEFTGVS